MTREEFEKALQETEWPGYDNFIAAIRLAPRTMLPSMLVQVMKQCEDNGVFTENGLVTFVECVLKAYRDAKKHNIEMV